MCSLVGDVAGAGGLSDGFRDNCSGHYWVDYGGGGAVDDGGGSVVAGNGEAGGTSVEGGWEGRVGVGGGVDRGSDVGDGGIDVGEGGVDVGGDGVEGRSSRGGCDQSENNEDLHVVG